MIFPVVFSNDTKGFGVESEWKYLARSFCWFLVELTFLVILVTGRADTAREAGEQSGGAADALHIERAAVTKAGADTGGGARGKTGDLGGGEAR